MMRTLLLLTLLLPAVSRMSASAADYSVVVRRSTRENPEWQKVVDVLVERYQADVIMYVDDVRDALPRLQDSHPRRTCFVTPHAEATREFVAQVHQLTRQYDDDPYPDTRWGILTGYDAANALAIAQEVKPLVIRKVAGGTELALECCEQGQWYDELVQFKHVLKEHGEVAEELRGPADTTEALAETLNTYQADLFVTSGHATERDWQIGFRYRNGSFRCRDGKLFGLDTAKQEYPIESPSPKVYMAVGNCLMGHIDTQDAMALAWLNSAGVRQMIGYTVLTWYGYAGWGCLDYFVEQPGRYTFVEAFQANQLALIHRLQSAELSDGDRRGLEYDRDVLAFYGDPGWDARMAPGQQRFDLELTQAENVYTVTIKPLQGKESFATVNNNGSQRGGRPFVTFLPERLQDTQLISGVEWKPVIADDFVLIPRPKMCDPELTYQIRFRATPIAVKN
ncbi:MAG: hypothetical protein KDA58_03355 [Planctomycetaceae bacterium]|nr:hypothetical protein [Planctomycetaceae bacterium]